MTSIERLRKLSEDMLRLSLWVRLTTGTEKDWDCYQGDGRTVNDELLSIADQIEREHAEDCFRMGERAAEDAEAIAWMRAHGGLDHVKTEWRSRVPYERYVRRRQSLLGHIAECETALGRRNRRIEELEGRVKALTNENADLRKRAMPEGYEWPRYESGELVQFGDDVSRHGGDFEANVIALYRDGSFSLNFWAYSKGERVKRLAVSAVLAADGEPLEVGQTVYVIANGKTHHVTEIDAVSKRFRSMEQADGSHWLDPMCFTHQRPVLDADGVPILEGDTVYEVGENYPPFIVSCLPKPGAYRSVKVVYPSGAFTFLDPERLTHTKPEPPDSAERIAEDIRRMAEEWCSYPTLSEASMKAASSVGEMTMGVALSNLSKRCRALAERERGE